MPSLPDARARAELAAPADLESLLVAGRFGDLDGALARLEAALPELQRQAEPPILLHALCVRAVLLTVAAGDGTGTDTALAACELLEHTARRHAEPLWAATGAATRAWAGVEAGTLGEAGADLARARTATGEHAGPAARRLFDVTARVCSRLRLGAHADAAREQLDRLLDLPLEPAQEAERAAHWAGWATELAERAMEPVAAGAGEPDGELMGRAVAAAARLDPLPPGRIPAPLLRVAAGVRALAAAYGGHGPEALRLLRQDAFTPPLDMPAVERQLVVLAAMRAHALVGSVATARSLDDATGGRQPSALPHFVLEVCRTRERLWLESHAGGDVRPVLHRMAELLVYLGWRGIDLVAQTARQALEHQALHAESRTDALTGVGNRRALDEELRRLLRFGTLPLALLIVDIDGFKSVNDRFGHAVGDEVLRRVADCLAGELRSGEQLLRYGGDEFVALLPGTGEHDARHAERRIRAAVSDLRWEEHPHPVRHPTAAPADLRRLAISVTTGSAAQDALTGRRPDADAQQLFARADERLLQAKRRRPTAGPVAQPEERPASVEVIDLAAIAGSPAQD